jgi:hypothetical protein
VEDQPFRILKYTLFLPDIRVLQRWRDLRIEKKKSWPQVKWVVSKSGNPGPGPVPKTRAQIRIFFITSLLRH